MLSSLKNMFKVPDLRNKILFTLMMLAIYRLGSHVPVPGIDLDRYKTNLIERFSNGAIRDTLARLCAESSDRIPKWLLPVVRDNLATGRRAAELLLQRLDEDGEPKTVVLDTWFVPRPSGNQPPSRQSHS